MSVLEYAYKFMELSMFVASEKLRMNHFEAGLNQNLKERMSMHQYGSCEDFYETTMNAQR